MTGMGQIGPFVIREGNGELAPIQTFRGFVLEWAGSGPLAAAPGERKEGRNHLRSGQWPQSSPIGVFAGLEPSRVPSLHEARLSGQPNRDMDDLVLAPHVQ